MARPKKYTLDELEQNLDIFWDSVDKELIQPTKERLITTLGIHRDTYNAWKKDEHEFSDTLKRTEARIEAEITDKLLTENNPTGKIFYLKNAFGWRDKTETDITSGGEKIAPLLGGKSNENPSNNSNK